MKKNLVSVILPVYNGEKYLAYAIQSVIEQDYSNLEIILIDDGSNDDSLKIMKRFQENDKRISIITRANKGLIFSLNEGIEKANGEWIMRMDADDKCLPDRVSNQITWLKATGADICGGWIKTCGDTIPRVRRFYQTSEAIKLQLLFNTCFAHPSVIGRANLFRQFKYQESERHAEDYGLWIRMAMSGARLTNYPGLVLRYRIHKDQITITKKAEQAEIRHRIAQQYRQNYFPKFGLKGEHDGMMNRSDTFSFKENMDIVKALRDLKDNFGDPENVISDNVFAYLARHGELGLSGMLSSVYHFGIPIKHKIILILLNMLRADQNSFIYNILYRLN